MAETSSEKTAKAAKAPRKYAPRNPEARRQRIIEAAADIIAREGSSMVTNRKVAERAGVPLGSTTQYFKSIDELRRAGLAEVARRLTRDYDEVFQVVAQEEEKEDALASAICDYLSQPARVSADAALGTAAIEDPEVKDIAVQTFERFLDQCEPYMDVDRAKILFAFVEGAVINSCFMGVPYDNEIIRKAVGLIMSDGQAMGGKNPS